MQKFGSFIHTFLTPLTVFVLAGVVIHDHVGGDPSSPRSTVNGKALGRSYAPIVASNLGDAWLAAASAMEQGKTVTEAQSALQTTWQEARIKAFTTRIAPEFSKVLPEGQEPTNPADRAEVVKLWRDFAAGLKGGR
jgi:hypothetical protein